MPELPEVETTRRGIAPHVVHHRIKQIVVRHHQLRWPVPPALVSEAKGLRIEACERRAKYLLLRTTKGTTIVHLGMSGSLRLVDAKSRAAKHDHVDIVLDSGQALRLTDPRRFGAVLWTHDDPLQHELLRDLGPEPLGKEFDGDYLSAAAHGRCVNVKQFIMDSKVVVGVGNIYASEDVETLNQLALGGALDLTKISYHALGHLRDRYALLRSGVALGRGCGPLIVAKPGIGLEDVRSGSVAIPGKLTTASLLLRLYDPALTNMVVMPFDRIMQAVADGTVTSGLIIHESRFTYPRYGLEKLLDLGEWWERSTGMPIPLGGIIGKRSLGTGTLLMVEEAIRESVRYARSHPAVLEYGKRHSQEMDESVMLQHIDLYVNDRSLDLGIEGTAAVRRLFAEAEKRTIFPTSDKLIVSGGLYSPSTSIAAAMSAEAKWGEVKQPETGAPIA